MPSARPIIGCLAALLAIICAPRPGAGVGVGARGPGQQPAPGANKHPVFFSELKLRSVVEATNADLRELKRAFMKHMTDIYLQLKLDSSLGFEVAREAKTPAASANMLMAEELAHIVIKRHIIQRRLLTGLKMAFVKFLPMPTLVKLHQKYKSYQWLANQTQVDLRPRFAQAKGESSWGGASRRSWRCGRTRARTPYAPDSPQIARIPQIPTRHPPDTPHTSIPPPTHWPSADTHTNWRPSISPSRPLGLDQKINTLSCTR